jgi:hypothetical protein
MEDTPSDYGELTHRPESVGATLGEEIFDIPVTKVESIIEPDCVANNVGWGAPSWNLWRL